MVVVLPASVPRRKSKLPVIVRGPLPLMVALSRTRRPRLEAVDALVGTGADLTQVGGAGLAAQLSEVPALSGHLDEVVLGIHEAFSLAIADTFWVGLGATLIALLVVVVGVREVHLRSSGSAPIDAVPEAQGRAAEAPASAS